MEKPKVTVLVVDDEQVIHKVVQKALRTCNYHLLFAQTAEEALAIVRSTESIEVALVDKNLPDQSGLDIIKDLKAQQPDIEVLLITGCPTLESAVEAVKAGAFDYIEKPLDHVDALKLRINNAADRVELKRAQRTLLAELQNSNERYELAVQGSTDGIWDWDLLKNTMYFSLGWQAMLGYARQRHEDHYVDSLGNSPNEWFERIHEEDLVAVTQALDSHITGHTPRVEVEYRILHRDGKYRWMLCRGLVVRDTEGFARRLAGTQTDIALRKSTEEGLLRDAFRDALTGLANRALLKDRLVHLTERVKRDEDALFAVLILDLDGFSKINGTLGHPGGNDLLIAVGQRLQASLRSCDTIARTGADEFSFLLENFAHRDEITAIAQRIQQQLAAPFQFDDQEIYVTVSMGVALGEGAADPPTELINRATLALHSAQSAGRGRCEFFSEALRQDAPGRLPLKAELERAIERHEFRVHYQPILDLRTEKIVGFEALVRWQHPERGLLLPAKFLPTAEETGLTVPLSAWILSQACHQAKKWRARFTEIPSLYVSTNLCHRQLSQADLYEQVEQALQESELDPSGLKLEVTENAITSNIERAITTLARLKSLGVSLCMDDFGTGHSPFSHLSRLPIDILKVDRSFVQRMTTFAKDRHLVQSIVLLAKNTGMTVIAEGVETTTQLEQLRSLNCDYAQGFLFSKAVDETEAEALLERQRADSRREPRVVSMRRQINATTGD